MQMPFHAVRTTRVIQPAVTRWTFLVVLMALITFSKATFASDLHLGSATGVAGTTLPIPTQFINNEAIVGLRFDISFDETALQPVAATPGLNLQSHDVFAAVVSPGVFRVVVNPTQNPFTLLPNGHLVQLNFLVLEGTPPGEIPLGLSTVQFADMDAHEGFLGNIESGSIMVRTGNSAPVAINSNLALLEDTVASGLLQATDSDGDSLTFEVVQQGQFGTIHILNPESGFFTYVPLPDAEGQDHFIFSAKDPAGLMASATVQLQIQPSNDAPTATSLNLQTREDEAVIATPYVEDVDVGESFSFTVLSPPAQGDLTIDSGQFTYSPDSDFNGTDSFTYRATDQGGQSVEGLAQILVTPVNDAPTAVALSFDLMEDTIQMKAPDVTDIDDTIHSFQIVVPPTHGTAAIQGDRIVYTPDADFNGPDQFMFRATDAGFLHVEGPATVTVHPVNDPPTSASAMLWACLDLDAQPTDPVVNDVDLQYEGDSFTFSIIAQPDHGTATVMDNQLGYSPDPDFVGPDSYLFQATDQAGTNVQGEVTVSVIPFDGLAVFGNRARGLGLLVFDATTDCGADPFQFEWQELGSNQILSLGISFHLDPPPDVTMDYEVVAIHPNNSQERRRTFRVLVHPAGLDLNGDGLNDLADLFLPLPFWTQNNTPFEADGDGELTILDLLYINLDDTIPTP